MNIERLKKTLIRHEGLKTKVYRCPKGKLTIGVGRNLEDKGISKAEAIFLLENDIAEIETELRKRIDFFDKLSDVRQEVLINMAFNLGINGLFKLKKMFKALKNSDYKKAAQEMLNSKWANQVGRRAKELAKAMEEDKINESNS